MLRSNRSQEVIQIASQILRHRSFCFQQNSQRYQALTDSGIVTYAARRQDNKNRQNSIDDLPELFQKYRAQLRVRT